ncbi:MAG: hypothetical protein OXH75_03845 [Acidobacteria bacterium]|nr:hypothetical protein [Acidobacteriota bacterium]
MAVSLPTLQGSGSVLLAARHCVTARAAGATPGSSLLREAVLFSNPARLGYALAYWAWLTAFVVVKEEPDPRRAFGPAFESYCREVPRWGPAAAGPETPTLTVHRPAESRVD